MKVIMVVTVLLAGCVLSPGLARAGVPEGDGWISLFNGKDLAGWKIPAGNEDIWKVVEGVIDCSPRARNT